MEKIEAKPQHEQKDVQSALDARTAEKDNDPILSLLNTFAQDLQKDIEGSWSFGSRKAERGDLKVDKVGNNQYVFKSYDRQTKFNYDGKTIALNSLLKWNANEITNSFRVMNILNSTIHEHNKNPHGVDLDISGGKKFLLDGNSVISWLNVPEAADSSEAKQKYFDLPLIGKRLPQGSDEKTQQESMNFLVDYLNNR